MALWWSPMSRRDIGRASHIFSLDIDTHLVKVIAPSYQGIWMEQRELQITLAKMERWAKWKSPSLFLNQSNSTFQSMTLGNCLWWLESIALASLPQHQPMAFWGRIAGEYLCHSHCQDDHELGLSRQQHRPNLYQASWVGQWLLWHTFCAWEVPPSRGGCFEEAPTALL